MMDGVIVAELHTTPVEPYLEAVSHKFTFKKGHYAECKTLEEVRTEFFSDLRPDYVVENIELFHYADIKEGIPVKLLGRLEGLSEEDM